MVRSLGLRRTTTPAEAEERLRHLVEDTTELEEEEREMIASVIELGDEPVREVMIPRIDVMALPTTATVREAMDRIIETGHSRIPLYEETIDNVTGMLYAKDLLRHLHAGKGDVPLEKILREAYFVPDSKKVSDLLRDMQQRRVHIAIVLDEYGSTAGLVTIEDLLEEIVGEIADEYDREEPQIEPAGEGRYRVNGRASIDEINELLDVELPHDEWDTVAGLLYGLLGSVPTQGETVRYGDLEFTAENVQGRRIAKVLITRRPPEAGQPAESERAARAE
jgi:CBS domain containing-hemolysin-like protein